jgi:hypothetical protein
MKLGDFGYEVRAIQELLNGHYNGVLVVDGHFGPKTDYYVKAFQAKVGLVVDGIVGPLTLSALKGKVVDPAIPAQPSGYYPPFANVMKEMMKERGTYAKGSPLGAIVHFTAGHDGAEKTIRGGIGNGFTFWCIQRDGKLFCAHPYNKWGYHAGESRWSHLAKRLVGSVSDDLLGIEINAYGRVTPIKGKPGRYMTWFKMEIGQDEVRYSPGKANQQEGYYHVYTAAQEKTLIETLLWLKSKNPTVFDFDFVLGHDEVAGMSGLGRWRKNDPGAALSITMPELRSTLAKRWAAR